MYFSWESGPLPCLDLENPRYERILDTAMDKNEMIKINNMDEIQNNQNYVEKTQWEGLKWRSGKLFIKQHFQANHMNTASCVQYSQDGKFIWSGSYDCSVKILDPWKMYTLSMRRNQDGQNQGEYVKPVVRNFYGHNGTIN